MDVDFENLMRFLIQLRFGSHSPNSTPTNGKIVIQLKKSNNASEIKFLCCLWIFNQVSNSIPIQASKLVFPSLKGPNGLWRKYRRKYRKTGFWIADIENFVLLLSKKFIIFFLRIDSFLNIGRTSNLLKIWKRRIFSISFLCEKKVPSFLRKERKTSLPFSK